MPYRGCVVKHEARRQRGVATLVTVMVLFFVMALVAAYANRNLIVEQRVAQSYQALGIATEVNHQAVARLLSLLNSGRVNDQCQVDPAGSGSLRDRLLVFKANGIIDVPAVTKGTGLTAPFVISCDRVRPGGLWQCQCPADFKPKLVADDGTARESFIARVRPFTGTTDIGRVGISVSACAASSEACDLTRKKKSDAPASWRVQSLLLLRSLKMPPTSPLVASGRIDLGTGMVAVLNEPGFGNTAVQAGQEVVGNRSAISGPAGSAPSLSVVANDANLAIADDDHFFRLFFGMKMADYIAQPAMRQLKCENGCATVLKDMVAAGAQVIWHDGDLTLGDNEEIGSVTKPFVLLVRGQLIINSPLHLRGVVFSSGNLSWTNVSANPSVVQGAVLVGGNVQADKGATALFDGAVINALKVQAGSFIQLPGAGHWEELW